MSRICLSYVCLALVAFIVSDSYFSSGVPHANSGLFLVVAVLSGPMSFVSMLKIFPMALIGVFISSCPLLLAKHVDCTSWNIAIAVFSSLIIWLSFGLMSIYAID